MHQVDACILNDNLNASQYKSDSWQSCMVTRYHFLNETYFFPDSRNASNSAAILQQRAWRLWDEEHSVTLRWPSGKEKTIIKENVIHAYVAIWQNFFVYMTLEWKSDMIVKYDHGCEVQVVKMNSETWLLFIPFSFVIST